MDSSQSWTKKNIFTFYLISKKKKEKKTQMDGELLPDSQRSVAKRAKPDTSDYGKTVWFISYASGSQDISNHLLADAGIRCDECYTIKWRESKYTLIHCKTRTKHSTLRKAMTYLFEHHGIMNHAITGYESLSSNDEKKNTQVNEHPGFQRMVELLNQRSAELQTWIEHGELLSYRKGLLWRYIESTEPQMKTHKQLVDQVTKWAPLVQEREELKESNHALQTALQSESQLSNQHFVDMMRYRDECRTLSIELEQKSTEINVLIMELKKREQECTKLSALLVNNGIDPRATK